MTEMGPCAFFISEMQRGVEELRAKCHALAVGTAAHAYNEMATSYTDFPMPEHSRHGILGTAHLDAMAHALLTMSMGDWERFYAGYVEWSQRVANCAYVGKEEENARGAMLLALRHHCKALQHNLDLIREAA